MDIASIFLIVAGALIIAVIWFLSTRSRAEQQRRHADLTERTERTMSQVRDQLAELNRRTGEVERISRTPNETCAHAITAVRTVVAVGLGVTALAQRSPALLIAAYATYWVGDIADGAAARALGQETRVGAVFDIVADRACTATCPPR
ncbi:CDP-alcohol phosphatidyltransferase family protein [Micromonospora sp. NPDC005305]|uniref:CDP-alcohol phosphatidyltransferase family protein n=1 Tax=Micromonospora sp. NPDC005305 TaxID=3156875 RepID=UPI0033BA78C3